MDNVISFEEWLASSKEVDKQFEKNRKEAMKRHPAGKGRNERAE